MPTQLEPAFWAPLATRLEARLAQWIGTGDPPVLWEAMAYSGCSGGKRMRPQLTLAAYAAGGGDLVACDAALDAACAIELIHAHSLIHDDLPCMDDDALRRGKPTSHVVFGEAVALLAGDALLALAFGVLARVAIPHTHRLVAEVADAYVQGTVAGQVLDIQLTGTARNPGRMPTDRSPEELLSAIHRKKTGALLVAAIRAGGWCAGGDPALLERLTAYGQHLGLAFQIADDMLDVTASAEQLGKTPGKDEALGKLTYVTLYGLARARELMRDHIDAAVTALGPLGTAAEPLEAIARYVGDRDR